MRTAGPMLATALGWALTGGCSAPVESAAYPQWQGTITEEGDATLVRNESGFVWPEAASLVEEASIGSAEGDDAYLFGQVMSITATSGQIVVVDRQVPAVRVYDFDGRYLHDLGAGGDGPGEYRFPRSARAIGDGRVFVRADRHGKILVFGPTGEMLEEWNLRERIASPWQMTVWPTGELFTYVTRMIDGAPTVGIQRFGPGGPIGEALSVTDHELASVELPLVSDQRRGFMRPQVFPGEADAFGPDGRRYSGRSDRYEFSVEELDPHVYTVSRETPNASVSTKEAEDIKTGILAWARQFQTDFAWNGPAVPAEWPAFRAFYPSASGAVWVLRNRASEHLPGCVEAEQEPPPRNPFGVPGPGCWRERYQFDVFGPDGRLLGEVAAPDGMSPWVQPHIDGDTVVALVHDDQDIAYVKRYRLTR